MHPPPNERTLSEASIRLIADRLGLPIDVASQDWPWEIAEHERIDDYMALYDEVTQDAELRYTLMDIIIQAFEDLPHRPERDPRWAKVLDWLEANFSNHAYQIWYWSCWNHRLNDCWKVTPSMRAVWRAENTERQWPED